LTHPGQWLVVQDLANSIIRDHNIALKIGVSKLQHFSNAIGNAIYNITKGTIYGTDGSASNGSWERYTQFGPGVAGDQPGGGSYDWNSYHGIGAYGKLRNGDMAMHPAYARQHYGIGPGQTYISDKDGKLHRFQDKSGAKAFNNEDEFVPKRGLPYKGASAGDTHVHFHIDAIDGASVHNFLNDHGDSIADRVHRHLSDRLSRSAVV
jgi:hypothetical protein